SEQLNINTTFPLSAPHFVHDANASFGRPLTTPRNAAVWTELQTPNSSIAVTRARISYATWTGGGAPSIASIDRGAAYEYFGRFTPGSIVDTAAGNAVFVLADNDAGGADLYMAPLNAATGVVSAT